MFDAVGHHWLLLTIIPLLIVVSLALNYKRARRWQQRIRNHGNVHCRSCGYVGALLVRALSSGSFSSSNLRLVCGKCNSADWYVPDDEKFG